MKTRLVRFLTALTLCAGLHRAAAQGTAFTYQGQLQNNGSLASGTYNLTFSLFTVSSGGAPIEGPVTTNGVIVTNGLFTVTIDFGTGVFTGATNWLQIGVETNGGSSFTTLTPRQQLAPAPYAIFAESASNVSGAVPSGSLSGTYSNAVTLNNASNSFTGTFIGNGAGLTNLSVSNLSLSVWQLTGNAGTGAGNFIGTTDNQAFQIRVAGAGAGLFIPTNGSPNIVLGPPQNVISNGTSASSILGGSNNAIGATSSFSVIGGGSQNIISDTADHSVVAGGNGNTIQANDDHSFIGSGANNNIQASADLSVLGGGQGNVIGAGAPYSFVGGGIDNTVFGNASYAVIGGGNANVIGAGAYQSVIGGGNSDNIGSPGSFIGSGIDNQIQTGDNFSVLGGGIQNVIWPGAAQSFLGGGSQNYISNNAAYSVLGGGANNNLQAGYSVIGGGQLNIISNSADHSVIIGGLSNIVSGKYATVPGGTSNQANGQFSFAAGANGQAVHNGAFVWSDAEGTAFTSTNTNSFNVRANGGARFVTGGAGLSVDGQPVLTSVSLSQLPASVVTNNEPLVFLDTVFLTGNLLLPQQATITAGLTPLVTADTNQNSFFGLDAGFDSKGASGSANTGIGFQALQQNTTGSDNVAVGAFALGNAHDFGLVAVGYGALQNDAVTGSFIGGANTAVGYQSLQADTSGSANTGLGFQSLGQTTGGVNNTAVGFFSLLQNTGGNNNTALGSSALAATIGNNNIGIGNNGGENLTSGNNNIDIGNAGNSGDSGIIRIGTEGTQTQAFIPGLLNCDALNAGFIITPGPLNCGPILSSGIVSGGAFLTGGTVTCCSITIAGGCDLAEPFQITGREQDVPEGAVVVIDEQNPGQLKMSDQPYDSHVAGVVSGANGIHPGIQMQQQGLLEGGKNVALTGRVYVQADASNGAIKPGDLLTTSFTPGRAMRVSDHLKAQGAILGKAMTGLKDGQGMVLVLVTLQ